MGAEKRLALILFCAAWCLCLVPSASAAPASATASATAKGIGKAMAIGTPNVQEALDEGLTALFDLEYERSRASFRRLIEREPENPLGYFFEAGIIWWQASSEYGLFKGTPTLQGLFEQDIEFAIKKAKRLTKSKDKRTKADGHFVLGMALGTKGMWKLLRWRWLDACFTGKKGIKHLKKCLKYDPEMYDAYLGLGVFDYQASRLPAVIKPMALLCGARSKEKRGLERIRLAIEKSRFSNQQAASHLAFIYMVDKQDYSRALSLIHGLRADYPESPYFKYLEAVAKFRLGDSDGSLSLAREIFELYRADPARFQRKLLTFVCSLSGRDCLGKHDLNLSLEWIDFALENAKPEDPEEWATFLRLWRGNVSDMLGRREQAQDDYEWVLDHAGFHDAHARARECLEHPCRAKVNMRYLKFLSQGGEYRNVETPKGVTP